MPFESSNLPGVGPIFPDWTFENWPYLLRTPRTPPLELLRAAAVAQREREREANIKILPAGWARRLVRLHVYIYIYIYVHIYIYIYISDLCHDAYVSTTYRMTRPSGRSVVAPSSRFRGHSRCSWSLHKVYNKTKNRSGSGLR